MQRSNTDAGELGPAKNSGPYANMVLAAVVGLKVGVVTPVVPPDAEVVGHGGSGDVVGPPVVGVVWAGVVGALVRGGVVGRGSVGVVMSGVVVGAGGAGVVGNVVVVGVMHGPPPLLSSPPEKQPASVNAAKTAIRRYAEAFIL